LLARPKASAVLIGTDTPTAPDGLSMAAHIQRLIDPRAIDRFRWIGAVPHDHAMRFVDDAAVVVAPSTFESFSFAAAEAVMRGRPVVVSDQVGLREHVPGLLTVPFGDADALAEAQLRILSKADEAHQQALRAREQLLAACRADRLLAERAKFYRSLPRRRSKVLADQHGEAMDWMSDWLRSIEVEESGEPGTPASHVAEPTSASLLHSR
jgi:glycosyltransferase involved in cell wall biosynthesis